MKRDIIGRCYDKSYNFIIENCKEGKIIYMGHEEKEELFEYLEKITMVKSNKFIEDPELLGKKLIFVDKTSWLEVA